MADDLIIELNDGSGAFIEVDGSEGSIEINLELANPPTVGTLEIQGTQGPAGPPGNAVPIAANSFLGNPTGAVANPTAVTPAQARTLLNLALIATSASASDLSSGTLPNARLSPQVVRNDLTYANPSWITSLASSKITGELLPANIPTVYARKDQANTFTQPQVILNDLTVSSLFNVMGTLIGSGGIVFAGNGEVTVGDSNVLWLKTGSTIRATINSSGATFNGSVASTNGGFAAGINNSWLGWSDTNNYFGGISNFRSAVGGGSTVTINGATGRSVFSGNVEVNGPAASALFQGPRLLALGEDNSVNFQFSGSGGVGVIQNYIGAQTVAINPAGGRVGIGVTNPSHDLEVRSNTGNVLALGGGSVLTHSFGFGVGGVSFINFLNTGVGSFQSNGSEIATINPSGFNANNITINKTGSNGLVVNNTSGNALAVFNASAAGVLDNAYLTIQTTGAPRWYVGQSVSALTGNFEIYSTALAAPALTLNRTTGAATFNGHVTASGNVVSSAIVYAAGSLATIGELNFRPTWQVAVPYMGMDIDPTGDFLRIRSNEGSSGLNTTVATFGRGTNTVTFNGLLRFKENVWNLSNADGARRLFFENNSTTYIAGNGSNPVQLRNASEQPLVSFNSNFETIFHSTGGGSSGAIFAGAATFNNIVQVNGFATGATTPSSLTNGEIRLGNNTSYQGRIEYFGDSQAFMRFTNTFVSPNEFLGIFQFVNGTTEIARISPTGNAEFQGRVKANHFRFANNSYFSSDANYNYSVNEVDAPKAFRASSFWFTRGVGSTASIVDESANGIYTSTVSGAPWNFVQGSGTALGIKVGSLAISDDYASAIPPTNGLFVKGAATFNGNVTIENAVPTQSWQVNVGSAAPTYTPVARQFSIQSWQSNASPFETFTDLVANTTQFNSHAVRLFVHNTGIANPILSTTFNSDGSTIFNGNISVEKPSNTYSQIAVGTNSWKTIISSGNTDGNCVIQQTPTNGGMYLDVGAATGLIVRRNTDFATIMQVNQSGQANFTGVSGVSATFTHNVSSNTEFRLGGNSYSRVAQMDGSGGWAGGYNFNINSDITQRDSTGTVAAIRFASDQVLLFAEGSGAPGAISARYSFSSTGANFLSPLTSTFQSLSADPSTLDLAAGQCRLIKNTTSGSLRLWANDGGTIKSVTLT